MSRASRHQPVMVDEVVSLLAATPRGVLVDATVGGAGHSAALLRAHPHLELIGLDRDAEALERSAEPLADEITSGRARLVQARFDRLSEVARSPYSAVLFDLGISSEQIDTPERGFSLRFDGPLDMRMDQGQVSTAADIVNHWSAEDLAELFRRNGENRGADGIARAVVAARPLRTTSELADVVARAVPQGRGRRRGHPATRVFQALRIETNEEIDILRPALEAAIDGLAPGGRIVVISYHSGEDRLVKQVLLDAASGGCTCPPGLPCVCGAVPRVRLLNRGARMASADEVERNPRASAARLRAAEKL
jgi:16S rRNA (cytosine1402-N4)-methyltransferase